MFNWKSIHRLSYSLCCIWYIWYICIGISLFCIRMQGMYIYTLDVQTATCRLSLDTQLLDTRLDQTTRRSIDPSPAFDPAASMDRPRLSLFCLDQQFRIQLRQNETSSQTDIHPVLVLNFWLYSGSILALSWLGFGSGPDSVPGCCRLLRCSCAVPAPPCAVPAL